MMNKKTEKQGKDPMGFLRLLNNSDRTPVAISFGSEADIEAFAKKKRADVKSLSRWESEGGKPE